MIRKDSLYVIDCTFELKLKQFDIFYCQQKIALFTEKCDILQLFPESCKITPNNPILSNEITIGANHKFSTLTLNGFKAICKSRKQFMWSNN